MLLPLLLTACLGIEITRPFDLVITAGADLPELTEDSVIQVSIESWTRSARTMTSLEVDCLVEDGWCEDTVGLAGMGRGEVEAWAWLDVDGDDNGYPMRAALDGDLLGWDLQNISRLPLEHPAQLVLLEPEVLLEDE